MDSNNGDSSSDDKYASSACSSPAPQPSSRRSLCLTSSAAARPLYCTHAFCLLCILRRYIRAEIHCPHCQRDTAVLPGGSAAAPSVYVVSYTPEPAARDGARLRCTSCSSRDNDAVAWCLDCSDLLCTNCAIGHHFMRFFKSHRFFPLVETQTPHEEPASYSNHRSETSFCPSCSQPLRRECTLLEQPRATPRLESLREAPPRHVEALSSELDRGRIQMRDLQAALSTVQLDRPDTRLEAQYEQAREKVAKAYDFSLYVLGERRQAIMDGLDSAYEESVASLRQDRHDVEDRIQRIGQLRAIVEPLTQPATDAEVVALGESLDSHFRELLTFQPEEQLPCSNLEFVSNRQEIQAVVPNTFGYVDVSGDSEEGSQQTPSADAVCSPADRGSIPPENGHDTPVPPCHIGSNLPSNYLNPSELPSASGDPLRAGTDQDPQGACALPLPNTRAEMPPQNVLTPLVERQRMTYFCTLGNFGVMEGQFREPSGIAVTAHNDIVVADSNNHCIQIFDQQCRLKRQFGEYGKRDGQLLYPNRVAVALRTGDIVVTERSPAHQIQVFTQDGQFLRKFGATILQHPRGVVVDNRGRMVVVENKVMRVTVFDRTGSVLRRFECGEHLEFPMGLAVNDREEVFIADNLAHCIKVFSYDGAFIRQIGGTGITDYPIAVCINDRGEVVVADNHKNFHLTVFTQDGLLVNALESSTKHAQCYDIALMDDGSVVLSSKDSRLYIYRYVRASTSFLPRAGSR